MSDESYPYNDDLLKTESDQDHARHAYPAIASALHFPQLLELVAAADAVANHAKRRMRQFGLGSVAMVTVALIASSAAPLYEQHSWSKGIVIAAGLLGILGGLVGLGLFTSRQKENWLQSRLVTESLRQFHFRYLLILAPEILDAAASGDPLDFAAHPTPAFRLFDQKRRLALEDITINLVRRKAEELENIVDPGSERAGPEIDPMPEPHVFTRPNGDQILRAYGSLRIQRQRQYADHKLLMKGGLFSKFPRAQAATLGGISIACVALLLLLHIASAGLSIWSTNGGAEPNELLKNLVSALDYLAIWAALIALALRTIEEGIKPHAEVERYRHYQATTARLLERFTNADIDGKLEAARAMEHAAYDEMVIFLRAHHEARFTM